MKKTIFAVALIFATLFASAQEQKTYSQDGNTVVYTEVNGKFTAISVNGVAVSDEGNKSTSDCYYQTLHDCALDKACHICCLNNPASQISWWAACLFGWLKQQATAINYFHPLKS